MREPLTHRARYFFVLLALLVWAGLSRADVSTPATNAPRAGIAGANATNPSPALAASSTPASHDGQSTEERDKQRILLVGLMAALLVIAAWHLKRSYGAHPRKN